MHVHFKHDEDHHEDGRGKDGERLIRIVFHFLRPMAARIGLSSIAAFFLPPPKRAAFVRNCWSLRVSRSSFRAMAWENHSMWRSVPRSFLPNFAAVIQRPKVLGELFSVLQSK